MIDKYAAFEMGVAAVPAEGERYCYPCSLVVLPDERLMATFTWGFNKGGTGRSGGCAIYSEDGGKNWTKPELIFFDDCLFEDAPDELQNFADPNVVIFNDKIVVYCVSLRHVPGKWDLRASRVWYRNSTDSGRTWSPIKEKEKHRKYISGTNHPGITLKDGSVIMGYSWEKKAETDTLTEGEGDQLYAAGILRTTDGGDTWLPGADAFVKAEKGDSAKEHAISGADEPAVVELHDGTLYMLLRTGTDHLWETISQDMGKSWSEPIPSPFISHNCPASLLRLEDGSILAIYNNHPVERARLCARLSEDGCRTWTIPRVFAPAGFLDESEASYPVLCQLKDGTIVTVWGEIKRSSRTDRFKICYARFNKEWIVF